MPASIWNEPGSTSRSCCAPTWTARFGSLLGTAPFLRRGRMRFESPVLRWWDCLSLSCNQRTRWVSYRDSRAACWGWMITTDWCRSPGGPWRRSAYSGRMCGLLVAASWSWSILWTCSWGGRGRFTRIILGDYFRVRRQCFDTRRIENVAPCAPGWVSSFWRGISTPGWLAFKWGRLTGRRGLGWWACISSPSRRSQGGHSGPLLRESQSMPRYWWGDDEYLRCPRSTISPDSWVGMGMISRRWWFRLIRWVPLSCYLGSGCWGDHTLAKSLGVHRTTPELD